MFTTNNKKSVNSKSNHNTLMDIAHRIEVNATASDIGLMTAYEAYMRICAMHAERSSVDLDTDRARNRINIELSSIMSAIAAVGRTGTKYFEKEFLDSSAEVLGRSCPDVTGQFNAINNNVELLSRLNTIYESAKILADDILRMCELRDSAKIRG